MQHGEYPESLEAVKDDLKSFQINDPARPKTSLGYRLEDDGYLIWSAGPDAKDDDGVKDKDWLWRMKREQVGCVLRRKPWQRLAATSQHCPTVWTRQTLRERQVDGRAVATPILRDHSFVIVSSRLSNTRATSVCGASSPGFCWWR